MPQFEPKTDSKEFEVLNAGQESIPAGNAIKDSTDLTIRLWYPQRVTAGATVTWKTASVLVYMIADLVAASRGRADESLPAMTAHFDSTGQALVAAKRVQTSILEFLTCRPGDSFASAVLIHQSSTTPGGFTPGMAEGALRLAEPGQILLSGETARRLQDLPGIQLRSVAGLTTGGEEFAGLAELVWTSPEHLERFRAQVHVAPRRDESQSLGATMIVNAPLGGPTGKIPPPVGTTGLIERQSAGKTENADSGLPPLDLVHSEHSFEPGPDESEQGSFLTGTPVIIGLAAVVLIAVLVWVFYPSSGSKRPARVQENQIRGTETPKTPTPDSSASQAPVQPPVLEPPAKPAVVTAQPTTPAKPLGQKRGKDKPAVSVPPPVGAPEVQQPMQGFEGMTQKDIPSLLQMARNDAGSGNYDRAKREYHVVLQMQPNNAEAREGLRRLEVATQSDR